MKKIDKNFLRSNATIKRYKIDKRRSKTKSWRNGRRSNRRKSTRKKEDEKSLLRDRIEISAHFRGSLATYWESRLRSPGEEEILMEGGELSV